jgi:hypothetical protein
MMTKTAAQWRETAATRRRIADSWVKRAAEAEAKAKELETPRCELGELVGDTVKFKDWAGDMASIEQIGSRIYFECEDRDGDLTSMGLQADQVKSLVAVLNRWLETGSFAKPC